jgi:hypothetical protein
MRVREGGGSEAESNESFYKLEEPVKVNTERSMSIAEQHMLLKKVTQKIEIDIKDKLANNFKDRMNQKKVI